MNAGENSDSNHNNGYGFGDGVPSESWEFDFCQHLDFVPVMFWFLISYQLAIAETNTDGKENLNDYCEDGYMNWVYSSNDYDNDGCHDILDFPDDDNDGFSDIVENNCLSSPMNYSSVPIDFDNDGGVII